MKNSSAARVCLTFLFGAALLPAAGVKIVINAVDRRNGWAFTDDAVRGYKDEGKDAAVVVARSAPDFAREVTDADGVIGGISKELFFTAKKLKWVQTYSAGIEQYRWKEFLEGPVVLTNCRIVQGPNIADHAMALLLSLTRGINGFVTDKPKELLSRDGRELMELQDMTAVII